MSMFLESFSHLMNKHPEDAEAIERLQDVFAKYSVPRGALSPEFSPEWLYDVARPRSLESMTELLLELVSYGVLQRIVRVQSPVSGIGLRDFSSLIEVPKVFHDEVENIDFQVNMENICFVYKPIFKELQ